MLSREDLLALVENAKELSSEIDLSDLLLKILQRAGQMTGSPSASFIVKDTEREGFYFAAAMGPVAEQLLATLGENGPQRIPENSKAGEVYRQRQSKIFTSLVNDPGHHKGIDRATQYRSESMVCVPLAIGTECLGVVQLLNKASGEYDDRDMMLLEHFAAHAAVAIRNAQYFSDLLSHKGLLTSSKAGHKTGDLLKELSAPAREKRMTVMFADMRGFTRLAQALHEPGEIEKHLNEFVTLLATQVMKHDGLVNKFLGDGVLALFGDQGCETRAVRCAFSIVEEFKSLKERWEDELSVSVSFLNVGVGIATGKVTIGCIGTGRVKDFTALGNYVNLAAAFESQARREQHILVDQATYNAAREIIADAGEPVEYELRKPDQPGGVFYKRIHLRRLRSEPKKTAADAPVPPGTRRTDGLRRYYNDSWAIVVGIDQYKNPRIEPLTYAVADAHAVAEQLPRVGFPSDHIEVLHNKAATKEAIHKAIYGKLKMTDPNDRLLVFFALHGQLQQQQRGEEGFLLPYDADPENLPLTAFPMTEFARIGPRLPPKHILFVLDTCFSGYAGKRSAPSASKLDLSSLTQESVVQLLTAGTGGQQAIEERGHGIFTRHFLKGLEGHADPSGTGLTALKLANYIMERVIQDSDNKQTPRYARLDGEGEFLFLPPE